MKRSDSEILSGLNKSVKECGGHRAGCVGCVYRVVVVSHTLIWHRSSVVPFEPRVIQHEDINHHHGTGPEGVHEAATPLAT